AFSEQLALSDHIVERFWANPVSKRLIHEILPFPYMLNKNIIAVFTEKDNGGLTLSIYCIKI
ncbi:MAG TPA: hypothetical protein K8V27_06820, partial [Butyricicoccus pullicaecorum]|nr:hypothetical protein [Butyricicoccus pullicaecorum]